MLETPALPLAQQVAGLTAAIRVMADERAAEARLVATLHALILAALARLLGRLEHLVELWQAGALPPPRTHQPRAHQPRTHQPRTHQPRPPVARAAMMRPTRAAAPRSRAATAAPPEASRRVTTHTLRQPTPARRAHAAPPPRARTTRLAHAPRPIIPPWPGIIPTAPCHVAAISLRYQNIIRHRAHARLRKSPAESDRRSD